MRSIRIAALLVAALGLAGGIPAAHAQSISVCTFTTHVTIDPGAGTTPNAGTFTSGGEVGSIECTGTLTGTGTIGYEGTYGDALASDTCLFGEGSGTFSLTIGSYSAEGTFHYVRAAVAGVFGGPTSDGGAYGGVFEFLPDEGQDCVNQAVTGATVLGQAVLAY